MSQLCWVSKPPCRSVAQIPTWHISIQLHPSHNFTLLSFHPVFGLLVLNLRRYVFICLVFPHCGLSADYMSWPLQTWSAAGMRTGHIIPCFFLLFPIAKHLRWNRRETGKLKCYGVVQIMLFIQHENPASAWVIIRKKLMFIHVLLIRPWL